MLELFLELSIRALRGFLPALPFLVAWFLFLYARKKDLTAAHMLCAFAFCLYLSGVLAVTGIGRPFGFRPRFNFLPFVDMVKGPIDTALNVILFLPLGVFLPLLYAEFEGAGRAAGYAFCLSLAIELTQMFGLGITDVNDLLTNTAGAWLGFVLSRKQRAKIPPEKKRTLQTAPAPEEALLFAAFTFFSALFFTPARR